MAVQPLFRIIQRISNDPLEHHSTPQTITVLWQGSQQELRTQVPRTRSEQAPGVLEHKFQQGPGELGTGTTASMVIQATLNDEWVDLGNWIKQVRDDPRPLDSSMLPLGYVVGEGWPRFAQREGLLNP